MNRTTIEWVKNPDGSPGYTWNPITGCLNHVDGLCKGGGFPCYAYKLAHGRLKHHYLKAYALPKDKGILADSYPTRDPFYPCFWEERLTPLHIPRKADSPKKGIFVCDRSDLFGVGIPQSWQEQVFNAIKANPDYRFYLLTKQPQNLSRFSPFPDNCYVGVTATNGKMVDDAGYWLEQIDTKVKFLSLEPLLEPIKLYFGKPGIDWLIIGACTGTYHEMELLAERLYAQNDELRFDHNMLILPFGSKYTLQPPIEWLREIIEAADKVGVKVFLKDNLEPLFCGANSYWEGFYAGNHMLDMQGLRHEMPE